MIQVLPAGRRRGLQPSKSIMLPPQKTNKGEFTYRAPAASGTISFQEVCDFRLREGANFISEREQYELN